MFSSPARGWPKHLQGARLGQHRGRSVATAGVKGNLCRSAFIPAPYFPCRGDSTLTGSGDGYRLAGMSYRRLRSLPVLLALVPKVGG